MTWFLLNYWIFYVFFFNAFTWYGKHCGKQIIYWAIRLWKVLTKPLWIYIQKILLWIRMNFQKNMQFPREKELSKEHFQLQTFISTGKTHKTCSVKPPQPAFHGVQEHTASLPVPEARSISLPEHCNSPHSRAQDKHNHPPKPRKETRMNND